MGIFPAFFGSSRRLGARSGLIITAAVVLVVANLVDLSAIASVGSAVALIIFLLICVAGYRRRADTGSSPLVIVLAATATAVVLGFFAVDTLRNAPQTFVAIVVIALAAVALDLWTRPPGHAAPTTPSLGGGR